MAEAARARLELAPARVDVEYLDDGSFILRSPVELEGYPTNLCTYLTDWARDAPERTFLAEREGNDRWREVSY